MSIGYGLIQSLGEDITYYVRSLGSRDSETNQPAVTWGAGTTVRAVMYKLTSRTVADEGTRGVNEQRWAILSGSQLNRGSRISRNSVYYEIDSTPVTVEVGNVLYGYFSEAVEARMQG